MRVTERGFLMAQSGRTLFQRIRCIKSSLESAEQSFLDNKDIRGELDLMLAEAELKNLRRKKDRPWSWNRQLLAGCMAVMIVMAGVGGWYIAKDHYKHRPVAAKPQAQQLTVVKEQPRQESQAAIPQVQKETVIVEKHIKQDTPAQAAKPAESRVNISKADMHKLVQSARVELSNSN